MNKDVIYIEPEDDITDIITKLEGSKEKIVALVPPKKASVLRSIVNIKLITKAAAGAEKTVVLVTTDPSIIKLAAATHLPVTKNLQSAPAVPDAEDLAVEETVSKEEVVAKTDKDGEEEITVEDISEETTEDAESSDEEKSDDKKSGNDGKKKKEHAVGASKIPPIKWIQEHKKLSIACGIGGVLLVLILIWAFAIAPAATITVNVRTTTSNFSENVTFTDKLADENVSEGKFYLEEKKLETKTEIAFEATGSKNIGEKASGEVIVYAYFRSKSAVGINAGTTFTISGLSYTSNADATLSWNGTDQSECENNGQASAITSGCLIAGRIAVTATAPGANYNIAASSTGWSTPAASVGVYSDKAMTGGTDKIVTVVQQSDINVALEKVETTNETESKERLLESVDDDEFVIESSFRRKVGDAVSTPALGEVVENGKKATLSVITTDSIYVVDETKVKEFISEKAKLADNYKIYSMNDPFIENFTSTESGYVGKLKTSYISGPKITENDVVETVRGKGLGTAQHDLKDGFDGISSITIDPSFPWVTSIPNDANKITVIINVDEQK